MTGIHRYDTENSIYFVDEVDMKYLRMPKSEKPRFQHESPWLVDLEWLPLEHVELMADGDEAILRIFRPGAVFGIFTSHVLAIDGIPYEPGRVPSSASTGMGAGRDSDAATRPVGVPDGLGLARLRAIDP